MNEGQDSLKYEEFFHWIKINIEIFLNKIYVKNRNLPLELPQSKALMEGFFIMKH